jgi:hypothetical protein
VPSGIGCTKDQTWHSVIGQFFFFKAMDSFIKEPIPIFFFGLINNYTFNHLTNFFFSQVINVPFESLNYNFFVSF